MQLKTQDRQIEEDGKMKGGPVGRRKYYPWKEILAPVYQSLQKYLYRKKSVRGPREMLAQERTPECNAKGRVSDGLGGKHYFPAPQQRTFMIFCITLGFSGCCLGCWAFGLVAGAARLVDARLGWLCWNCACVEAASGGASSPMLFLLICESRCMVSLGLLPGGARVAPGLGRGSFKRW